MEGVELQAHMSLEVKNPGSGGPAGTEDAVPEITPGGNAPGKWGHSNGDDAGGGQMMLRVALLQTTATGRTRRRIAGRGTPAAGGEGAGSRHRPLPGNVEHRVYALFGMS